MNIGPKWEELMKKTTKNSLEYNSNFKRGNFVMDAFKKGKMGIDALFF